MAERFKNSWTTTTTKVIIREAGGDKGNVIIDVGSYSEFFVLKGISHSDYTKALQKEVESEEDYHQIAFDEYLEGISERGN